MTPDLIALARECGFDQACPLDPGTLRFLPEVRAMCAADKCRSYNRSWSCPPAAGALPELEARCRRYRRGLLVQTVGDQEDSFDVEALMDTRARHQESFRRLTGRMKELFPRVWPMGDSACARCETCTWPDAPCRFPQEVYPSMEACGLLVSQVCADNGMKYYYGPKHISFTYCYLFDPTDSTPPDA